MNLPVGNQNNEWPTCKKNYKEVNNNNKNNTMEAGYYNHG